MEPRYLGGDRDSAELTLCDEPIELHHRRAIAFGFSPSSVRWLSHLSRPHLHHASARRHRARLSVSRTYSRDEQSLRERGLQDDAQARAKLAKDRATERMSWVFSAFVAGYVLFEVPGGWLGDRWGARAVIFRIVLCWSLFTAATGGVKGSPPCSLKAGPEQWLVAMIAIRFLFGVGEAGAYPNIARALGRWFPIPRTRDGAEFHLAVEPVGRRVRADHHWRPDAVGGGLAARVLDSRSRWSGLGSLLLRLVSRPSRRQTTGQRRRTRVDSCGEADAGSIYDDRAAPRVPLAFLFHPTFWRSASCRSA
jgi:hypothetical protein